MSDEYRDIINLPHHVSSKRPLLSPAMMTQFMKPHGLQMMRLTSAKRKRKHWTESNKSS